MTGSVVGGPLPGPEMALCSPFAVVEREVTLLGRLRKDLQALVFRHR